LFKFSQVAVYLHSINLVGLIESRGHESDERGFKLYVKNGEMRCEGLSKEEGRRMFGRVIEGGNMLIK